MREFTLEDEQYLSDLKIIGKLILEGNNCILHSRTNTGKTEACLKEVISSGFNFIFAVDCILLANQLGKQYGIPVFYKGKHKPKSNCITIYNHVAKFTDSDTILIVDEFHTIIKDYG